MANSTFTQVPNFLYEKLFDGSLSYSEERALAFIIRKTHGFHKQSDKISYGQIVEATGMSRSSAIRAIKKLNDLKLIRVKRKSKDVNVITVVGSVIGDTRVVSSDPSKLVSRMTPTKHKVKEPLQGGCFTAPPIGETNKSYLDVLKELEGIDE